MRLRDNLVLLTIIPSFLFHVDIDLYYFSLFFFFFFFLVYLFYIAFLGLFKILYHMSTFTIHSLDAYCCFLVIVCSLGWRWMVVARPFAPFS